VWCSVYFVRVRQERLASALCCSVLQCLAVCCNVYCVCEARMSHVCSVVQCVAVCFSVLQCVAVCCSELQCVVCD